MNKILMLLIVSFSCTYVAQSQTNEKLARKYAATITDADLTRHLTLLASDSLEGRETGKKGQKMAAEYIKNHFQEIGLTGPVDGSYFQKFDLYQTRRGDAEIIFGTDTLKNLNGMVYWSSHPMKRTKVDLIFINEANNEDLSKINVKDQFVVFKAKGQFTPVLSKLEEAGAKGAVVLAEDSSKMKMVNRYGQYYVTQGAISRKKPEEGGMVSIVTYKENADKMFGKPLSELKIGDKVKAEVFGEIKVEVLETENVLGFLEGGEMKDEILVLTAHYDHEGIKGDEIYNGADDDASGTTAVMEIAEAFALAKKEGNTPKRSILFMPVTGEEKGLLGSAHYAENPVFPLENTITNLNIDMIGRVDSAHKEDREFVYLIGSDRISTELHEISENMNAYYTKLELDYTYNAEDHPDRIYYRSDHWNFAKNGVPIIFYFNGTHDDYHRPTDTVEKIEFDVLKKRTDLVFYTAWELANRPVRPAVDIVEEEKK